MKKKWMVIIAITCAIVFCGAVFGISKCRESQKTVTDGTFKAENNVLTGFTTEVLKANLDVGAEIVIPSKIEDMVITEIGRSAFKHLDIKKAVIPDTVTKIGNGAFLECDGLEEIVIGSGVTVIDERAFDGCENLTRIVINGNLKTIGANAFDGVGATEIILPDSVTEIGDFAFTRCVNLTSISIPNAVKTIGYGAFIDCRNLIKVIIPNSVTTMKERVFSNCAQLTIYCRVESKPSGWNDSWNSDNCPVEWGYKGN